MKEIGIIISSQKILTATSYPGIICSGKNFRPELIQEDSHLDTRHRKNLISYVSMKYLFLLIGTSPGQTRCIYVRRR
jgi:hypothetical protein